MEYQLDFEIKDIKWDDKGLVPAIIQNNQTREVLMLGYMNEAALEKTLELGKVTFWSRSKNRLWTKGESSNNYLELVAIQNDCDKDSLLIQARPQGPTCHTGTSSCWGNQEEPNFLKTLESIIDNRLSNDSDKSYVNSLTKKGIEKVAQKVGEEGVEVVIEALGSNDNLLLNESADLLFHLMILLKVKGYGLKDVEEVLRNRNKKNAVSS